jgi:LEA14-like dessication related protein
MKSLRWCAVFAALWLGACASGPKLQTPEFSIVSARMLSADVFAQQFAIRLHVQNPNDRALPVKGIDYQLYLEGDPFAEGVSTAPFVVPANGEQEFDMTVKTTFMSSIAKLVSKLETNNSRTMQYQFMGKVMVDIPFVKDIPFGQTGTVDLTTKR